MKHRLRIIALAMAAFAVFSSPPAAAAKHQDQLTVVELFTSQGCALCPPADALLGELTKRSDLLALSFHVNYWDYIGWKDTFASAANTNRQRTYARKFGLRYVYTPQMVVQGVAQATGSDRASVLDNIEKHKPLSSVPIKIQLGTGGRSIIVTIDAAPKGKEQNAEVWLVMFDREQKTTVSRGENSGKTLSDFNVVRSLRKVADWDGRKLKFTAKPPGTALLSGECAVLLQSVETGRILGAAKLALN